MECQVSLRADALMNIIISPIKLPFVHFPRKQGWPVILEALFPDRIIF